MRWYHRPLRAAHLWVEGWMVRRLMRTLAGGSVTHFLHTHYLVFPHMTARRPRWFPALAHAVVVTDYEAHAYWVNQGIDRYFVGAECVADELIGRGVLAERIAVSGIPVDPVWHEKVDETRVRGELGVSDNRPIVLIVAGSNFTLGPFAIITEQLAAALPESHLVVVAGRDPALKAQLDLIAARHDNVTVFGYTTVLDEWMAVSDLLVSKPGGLITSEALARSTPLVMPAAIPGQETANAAFLEAHQAGRIAKTADETVAIVCDLLKTHDALAAMRTAAGSLSRNGAAMIAQAVREWLS